MEEQKQKTGRPKKVQAVAPEVAPVETKVDNGVMNLLTDLVAEIGKISNRLTAIEQKPVARPVTHATPVRTAEEKRQQSSYLILSNTAMRSDAPLPIFDALKTVASGVLGEEFEYEFEMQEPQGMFAFTITIPEKFVLNQNDDRHRTKIITNAEGEHGVREWAERVRQNLIQHLAAAGKTLQ